MAVRCSVAKSGFGLSLSASCSTTSPCTMAQKIWPSVSGSPADTGDNTTPALYSAITSHRELMLIRAGNKAAALSFGGAIVGFVIPVGKAVAQSTSLLDLLVWSAIAFVAQLCAYGVAALMVPHLRKSIEEDQIASGIVLTALAIAIGVLNAAAMAL